MSAPFRILTVNPGSTSTKMALYEDERAVADMEVSHTHKELARFERVYDQLDFREAAIDSALAERGSDLSQLDCVVGRGGFLHPVPGGAYAVNEDMIADLSTARYGDHACNLGAELAVHFAERACRADGSPAGAIIVDPVVTDELMDVARITGLPGIQRRSSFHALNQRGAARTVAAKLGVAYENEDFLVAHVGGGVSVGAHCRGRVAEVTNALDGEGPFTAERTGALPLLPVLDMIESGAASIAELRHIIMRNGGLLAHLGTTDLRKAEAMAAEGGEQGKKAALVLEAMAYGIARAACSLLPAFVLEGNGGAPCAIVLTGGMARSGWLKKRLENLIGHIAPLMTITGMEEMGAMASGALRMLRGEAPAIEYRRKP